MVLWTTILLPVLLLWIETFAFKSIVSKHGENVKGNIVKYMKSVIRYDIPNADTIMAIQEVQDLKKDPNKKVYNSFSEVLEDLENDKL